MYQGAAAGGTVAPETSHGDGTGPQSAARYRDQAAYGQSGAQSYEQGVRGAAAGGPVA